MQASNDWVAIATFLLAIVTIILAGIATYQACKMRQSVHEQVTLRLSQAKPLVVVDTERTEVSSGPYTLRLIVRNDGHGTAFDVHIGGRWGQTRGKGSLLWGQGPFAGEYVLGSLAAGAERKISHGDDPINMLAPLLHESRANNPPLPRWLVWQIGYEDVFRRRFRTTGVMRWRHEEANGLGAFFDQIEISEKPLGPKDDWLDSI